MASVSMEIARDGSKLFVLATGSDIVTLGTAAPTTANTVQLRIDNAAGFRREELLLALERFGEAILKNADLLP